MVCKVLFVMSWKILSSSTTAIWTLFSIWRLILIEINNKFRALKLLTLHKDLAAHRFHLVFCHIKSQAFRIGVLVEGLIELEDIPGVLFQVDSPAVVAEFQEHVPVLPVGAYSDEGRPFGTGIFQGVVQKIHEDAFQVNRRIADPGCLREVVQDGGF